MQKYSSNLMNKKEIFFTGPIQYDKHFKSLVYLSFNIIQSYLFIDLFVFIINEIFSSEFYVNYYDKCLLIRIIINLLCGSLVYLLFTINYDIIRYSLCSDI